MVVMVMEGTHIIHNTSNVVYIGYKSVIITTTHKNGQISIGPRARAMCDDDGCCGSVLGQFIFVQTLT